MKKSDFTKGQIVYMFIIPGSNAYRYVKDKAFESRIIPAAVVSVGNKYISVKPDKWTWGNVIRFHADDFSQVYDVGGADYQIFLSEQDIYDYQEAEDIYNFIKFSFSDFKNQDKYSLSQLRRVREILKEKAINE